MLTAPRLDDVRPPIESGRRRPSSPTPPLPPQRAGDRAYRLFCRPDLSPYRPTDQAALVARARVHLARAQAFTVPSKVGAIQAYVFAPTRPSAHPRTHLLIHGWTSEAAFMAAFVEPLRSRGDRVIALDLPAHGRTPGPWDHRAASLMDCAHAALAVARHIGTIDCIVGHSLGALIAAMLVEGGAPLDGGVQVGRIALLAAPNRVQDVTRRYGAKLGLSPAAQACYERHVERVGHRPLAPFSTGRLLMGAATAPEVLAIHSTDDATVPFADASRLVAEFPTARLVAVDGLGHGGVLFAPPVVRLVRDFVAPVA